MCSLWQQWFIFREHSSFFLTFIFIFCSFKLEYNCALQCYVTFCYTALWTSCTYILSLLNLPPTSPHSTSFWSSTGAPAELLCCVATSHQLFTPSICKPMQLSVHPTLSFPNHVHKSSPTSPYPWTTLPSLISSSSQNPISHIPSQWLPSPCTIW